MLYKLFQHKTPHRRFEQKKGTIDKFPGNSGRSTAGRGRFNTLLKLMAIQPLMGGRVQYVLGGRNQLATEEGIQLLLGGNLQLVTVGRNRQLLGGRIQQVLVGRI